MEADKWSVPMRVGVVGINHKLADLKLRERLAKACQKRFRADHSIHLGHYFVLLSTCNRTEIYFSSQDLTETHSYILNILRNDVQEEFDHKLYSYFGNDCFIHLARVTAGLDSAILAETEIQGQVKTAYETSFEFNALPKEIHFLFQKSLGIAKKLRTDLQLGRGMPNLEHAIFNTGKYFFHTSQKDPKILFVGASEINLKLISYLKSKDLKKITLCNRSLEHSKKVAEEQSISYIDWNQLYDWCDYDWIIFGTKSPDYLIKKNHIPENLKEKKLIMDLCVPRNVDPLLAKDSRITLMNIDQLNRLLKLRNRNLNQSLLQAENMIFDAVRNQINRYLEKEEKALSVLINVNFG